MSLALGVRDAKTWLRELRARAPDCFTMNEFSFRVSSEYGKKVVASNQTKLNLESFCWSQRSGALM